MDLSDFSQSNFDPKEWINSSLKTVNKEESIERVNSIAMKLQLCFHQLNGEFENTGKVALQSLPRIVKDIQTLSDEAETLREKMTSVKQEIAKVEKDTGASMAFLEKMDNIKMVFVKAREALHEADNWTVLSGEMEKALEGEDIDVITGKLTSMQQSLLALEKVSDFEEKKAQLEVFKNRFEALASPAMVQAFTLKSMEQSKKFVNIFQVINRLPQFLKYYKDCQKALLLDSWNIVVMTEGDNNVLELLQNYYGSLFVNWHEQIKWCQFVIPKLPASATLFEIYTDLLVALSPELIKHIDNTCKQMSEPLQLLVQLKGCSQQFLTNLTSSTDLKADQEHIFILSKAVFMPYQDYIEKYGSFQKASFHRQFSEFDFKKENLIDKVQNLGQVNSEILSKIGVGHKLCLELTEGCSYFGFVEATEWFCLEFLTQYQKVMSDILANKGNDEGFNIFQVCLTLLENLGSLLHGVKVLDKECVENITNLHANLDKNDLTSSAKFVRVLLSPEEQKVFLQKITNLQNMAEPSALRGTIQKIQRVCPDIHTATFHIIYLPIATQLDFVKSASSWAGRSSNDLPDYSFVPHDYVTQIGQYLLNLPQLLEPFIVTENPSLTLALSCCGSQYSHLMDAATEDSNFPSIFLGLVIEETCDTFCSLILSLNSLSPHGSKQLATDISLLSSVLTDLGFSLTDKLNQILQLLKLSQSEYATQSVGYTPKYVAAIRQMRNFVSE